MISLHTAEKMKKAGWPQHMNEGWVTIPTLAEVIHACREYREGTEGQFHPFLLEELPNGDWMAGFNKFDLVLGIGTGVSPEEATCNCWLALVMGGKSP